MTERSKVPGGFERAILAKVVVVTLVSETLTLPAFAEPSASGSHRLVLWAAVLAGSAVAALLPHIVRKRVKARIPGWVFWVASLALAVLAGGILGPIFVAIASIFLSGRTM